MKNTQTFEFALHMMHLPRIIDLHKTGKSYKVISQSLDIHQSAVRQTVHKWSQFSTVAPLHRSGCPAKVAAKAQCRMLQKKEAQSNR